MSDKNYEAKTIDIEGKAYVPVHERIKEFYSKYPFGHIVPVLLSNHEQGLKEGDTIIMKAYAYKYPNDPTPGIGHSQIIHGKDYFKTSALETVETSAVGRALGMMGIGIREMIATSDEVTKSQDQKAATEKKPETPKVEATEDLKTVDPKEQELFERFQEAIELAETVDTLKLISAEIKKSDLSITEKEKLRLPYNKKMKKLKEEIK